MGKFGVFGNIDSWNTLIHLKNIYFLYDDLVCFNIISYICGVIMGFLDDTPKVKLC